MAAKRSRSLASEALEISSRRKISLWLYREWIISCSSSTHLGLEAVRLAGTGCGFWGLVLGCHGFLVRGELARRRAILGIPAEYFKRRVQIAAR